MPIVNKLPESAWRPVTTQELMSTTALFEALPEYEQWPLLRHRGAIYLGQWQVGVKKVAYYFLPINFRHSDFWMNSSELMGGTRLDQQGIDGVNNHTGLVKVSRKRLDAIRIEQMEFEELPRLFQQRYVDCEKAFCRDGDLPSF